MNRIRNERGFLMLNVVFLTLITSFAAMILLNAAPRVRNSQSQLRLTALYLAEEQFAELESAAVLEKKAPTTKTTTRNLDGRKYQVEVEVSGANPRQVTVTISWTDGGKTFEVKAQRMIWVAES